MSLENYREARDLMRAHIKAREKPVSNHISKEEFEEAVRAKNWGFIWAAYQYACNGGETSLVDRLKQQLEEGTCYRCRERERIMASLPQDGSRGQKDAWDEFLDRISALESEIVRLKDFQKAKEKTVEALKKELDIAEAFHKVVVKERDFERIRVERLEAALKEHLAHNQWLSSELRKLEERNER